MDDKRFDEFFKDILRHEGGYVNDPNDAGGETKFGISKKSYPHLDIKNLTVEEAKVIYYYDFYVKGKFDKIAKISFQVATKGCDIAINVGISRAHKILIKAISDISKGVEEAKGIGEDFLLELQRIVLKGKKEAYINNIIKHQKEYYISLVKKNNKLSKFLKGWLRRAEYPGVTKYG